MDTKNRRWALIAAVLALVVALALPLAACGGGGQADQADQGSESSGAGGGQEQAPAVESADEKVAFYIAGYDQISEENTLNNPDPFTYERVCSILGDDGKWLAYDNDNYDWIPFEGIPTPGEECALEYAVEGVNGAVLVMWSPGKDYETENFSSISNTFERE